jgi:hypothetical protein
MKYIKWAILTLINTAQAAFWIMVIALCDICIAIKRRTQ